MVAMVNWFYTRRGTYYMLHFSILGIEAIFGWRAAEFYASLFAHLASGFALALVCIAIGLIVWIFGFALSTHYRFAIESVIELTRKRASGAINETWVKVQAYVIIGAAIALVLANDVAGAVYLSLQASLDTPQFVMAIVGLCAFIALPFLVGYFLPALAASLPAEEQARVLDALLRQTWDLLRYESEHRVKKHMSGIRRGEVHAFASLSEAIDALLSGADPSLPHVQALLKLKEAGALNFQGTIGAPPSTTNGVSLKALHAGPATNGALLKAGNWSNTGSGGWTTDLTLSEAIEELAEQVDLEITEAEVLDMQRRGKITLYKDKDGAWRMDLKNFALLKLALGLHADVQPAVPIAPPTPEHSQPEGTSVRGAFPAEGQDRISRHLAAPLERNNGHLASPVPNAVTEGARLPLAVAEPKPEPPTLQEIVPRRGAIRAGITYGVIPADCAWVTVAECALVSGYSVGHMRNLLRKGVVQQPVKNRIPAQEALRLYEALRQALAGTNGTADADSTEASNGKDEDLE